MDLCQKTLVVFMLVLAAYVYGLWYVHNAQQIQHCMDHYEQCASDYWAEHN